MSAPGWQIVARASILGRGPGRRAARWRLHLACGCTEERAPRYRSRPGGQSRALPAPARVRHACPAGPDVGVHRAAEELTARLGFAVNAYGVAELIDRGIITAGRVWKGWQLYDGASLRDVTAAQAAAAQAAAWYTRAELDRESAARYLGIRQSDFELLLEWGIVIPDRLKAGEWGTVRLFHRASLDAAVAARPDIDWAAVRATRKGQRTRLAEVIKTEKVLRALGAPPPPKVRRPRTADAIR